MSNESKQTNQNNGDPVAGTGMKTVTPRDSTGTIPVGTGASGETSEPGNRNKAS